MLGGRMVCNIKFLFAVYMYMKLLVNSRCSTGQINFRTRSTHILKEDSANLYPLSIQRQLHYMTHRIITEMLNY